MSQRRISSDGQRRVIAEVRNTISRGSQALGGVKAVVDGMAADSFVDYTVAPTTFGSPRAWGLRNVPDSVLKFTSEREPVVRWLVYWVAVDIYDNWYKVVDPGKPNSEALDDAVQRVLKQLKAKRELTRLATFDRRYGTAILLCAYTGMGDVGWETPIYTDDGEFIGDGKLLQITPYPWTKVNVVEENSDTSSIRFGLPEFYEVTRGKGGATKVHWSRVIHSATRLDEESYKGVSVVLAVYDDATGFRNLRWAMYETMFRYGSGFPVFTFPWATKEEIRGWIASGEVANWNARGYLVAGEEEETVEFKGMQEASLDPAPYFEKSMQAISTATRIPMDVLIGVSAGRITGSEVNERAYFKFISSEQSMVEHIDRELIDRLFDTGQITYADARLKDPEKNYDIMWNSGFSINELDSARVKLWESTAAKNDLEFMTVDEVRDAKKLKKLPKDDGKVVLGLERIKKTESRSEAVPPQETKGKSENRSEEPPGEAPEEVEPV